LEEKDTYITITQPSSEILHKDRNSKFYGYAFPVTTQDEIKIHLDALKKKHYQAGHFCYAWRLGMRYENYRYSDDGEPSNSAGAPIYGQIQSFDLTNTFIVVVRCALLRITKSILYLKNKNYIVNMNWQFVKRKVKELQLYLMRSSASR